MLNTDTKSHIYYLDYIDIFDMKSINLTGYQGEST
jgi:hypothetical protein